MLKNASLNNEVVKTVSELVANEVSKSFLESVIEDNITFDGSRFFISDKKVNLGLNAYEYVCYVVTKKALTGFRANYLPTEVVDQAERLAEPHRGWTDYHGWSVPDVREAVGLTLLESLRQGKTAREALDDGYAIIDSILNDGEYKARDNKSLPKEEILDIDFRRAVEDICSLNPIGVEDGFSKAVYTLFDAVKKAHPYATEKRWLGFEYFILNKPNNEIADLLAISKQKASKNNREMIGWFIDEVNKDRELRKALGL